MAFVAALQYVAGFSKPFQKLLQETRQGKTVKLRLLDPLTFHVLSGFGQGEAVEVGVEALVGEDVKNVACDKLKGGRGGLKVEC